MGKYQIDLLIQKQSRVGICKPLSPLIVLLSFVIFHANMFYSRLHSSWGRNAPTLYLYRSFNDEGNSINYSLIQMAQKDWHHLQFIVTWVTKMGLAWRVRGTNNYVRDIHYTGASLSQLASLTKVSSNCEQFIQYECHHSMILLGNNFWTLRTRVKQLKSGPCDSLWVSS